MRHPRVAAVGVVLDDDEPRRPAAGAPASARMTADLPVARHVMEAVGRDQPVELAGRSQRPGEVGDERRVSATAGKRARTAASFARSARASRSTATIRPPGPSRSARASVNAPSPAPMSAHVPPGSTAARSRRDVIARGPRLLAGALEPGRDAVDGQLDEAQHAVALGIVGRHRAQPGEQPDLELGQRVDVRVAQRDRALQDRRAVEQALASGDPAEQRRRSGGTRPRSRPSGGRRRRRVASAAYSRATPMSALARLISALSRRLARNGQSRASRAIASSPASPCAARYASSAVPEPVPAGQVDARLRPGERPRDRPQRVDRRRASSRRPRAAGREPSRRSDSSRIGVMSRKNAAKPGSSWTSAR